MADKPTYNSKQLRKYAGYLDELEIDPVAVLRDHWHKVVMEEANASTKRGPVLEDLNKAVEVGGAVMNLLASALERAFKETRKP